MNLKKIIWFEGKYFDNRKNAVNPSFIGDVRILKDVTEGDLIDLIEEDLKTLQAEKFSKESNVQYDKINSYLIGCPEVKISGRNYVPIHFCQI